MKIKLLRWQLSVPDITAWIPTLFILLITKPYWGEAPPLDAMIMYRQAVTFFQGGIWDTIRNASSIHPPLLFIYIYPFFRLFGLSPTSYSFAGIVLFSFVSIKTYGFLKQYFGKKMAIISSLLLFTNPLIIINAFYLNNDFFILAFTLIALISYTNKQQLLHIMTLCMMVLMKETALLIILCFIILRLHDTKLSDLKKTLCSFIPILIVYILWISIRSFTGSTEWNAYIFTNDQSTGSFGTVIQTLASGHLFNEYTVQNIFNTFALNLQWVPTITTLLLWFCLHQTRLFNSHDQLIIGRNIIVIAFLYFVLIFSFPTWTIPRYGIPLYLCLYVFLGIFLTKLKPILSASLMVLLLTSAFLANIQSIDPLVYFLGRVTIQNENFYGNNYDTTGPDGLFYNLQIAKAVKRQNLYLMDAIQKHALYVLTNCDELKIEERIETINANPEAYPQFSMNKLPSCLNIYQFPLDQLNIQNLPPIYLIPYTEVL